MSPPLPPPPMQLQFEPQMLQLMQMMIAGNLPLNLSLTRSINLAKVSRYDVFALTEEQEVKEGNKTVMKTVETGEMAPGIVVDGEVVILTEAENKQFRGVWGDYCTLTSYIFTAARSIAGPMAAAVPGAAAPVAEIPPAAGGVQ
jgi:hypothetical protein